jgi:hypothetical protein
VLRPLGALAAPLDDLDSRVRFAVRVDISSTLLLTAFTALRLVWLCGALSPCIAYLATSPWFYGGIPMMNTLFSAGLDIVATMAIIDMAGPRRAAQYAAMSATFTGIRGVLGPPLGAAIISLAGVRAVYLIAACMMAFTVWLLPRQVRTFAWAVPSYQSIPSSPSAS